MRNRLSALHYRVDLVGAATDKFQQSLTGYEKIHQILDSHCAYRMLLPLKHSFLGNNLEAIVSSTPLLDLIHINNSTETVVPQRLDPHGHLKKFIRRKTHVFTEDNVVDVIEVVKSK